MECYKLGRELIVRHVEGGMCEEVGVVRGRVSMQRIVMRGEVPMRGVRIFVRVVGVEGEMVIVERC